MTEESKAIECLHMDVLIDGNDWTQIAAVRDGEMIGTVEVQFRKRTSATLRRLFVKEPYRRIGVGRQLLQGATQEATLAQCFNLALDVHPHNHEVIPFYKHCGFKIAMYWDDGSVLMTKDLR